MTMSTSGMTGGDTLVQTLIDGGIDICFANPGTSEMHFVGALDRSPRMRCVLGLFEGVVSGAADGFQRLAGSPAATLLHLGPGFGNALANLHNAGKGHARILNIVGDHATYHRGYASPLNSRIEQIVGSVSDHVLRPDTPADLARQAARAVGLANNQAGLIVSLILPADLSWLPGEMPVAVPERPMVPEPDPKLIEAVALELRKGATAMMLLGGDAVRGRSLELAGRIAAKTGCQLLTEGYNQRHERGAGRVKVDRLPTTSVSAAVERLAAVKSLVLMGAAEPIAFFAYPDAPSKIAPEACSIIEAVAAGDATERTMELLCTCLEADGTAPAFVQPLEVVRPGHAALTPEAIGAAIAFHLPANAIVVDESVTTGRGFAFPTATAAPHDWLSIMGGSIGFAMPCAIGAAIAAPDRKVVALAGDGSAMYTPQALWTMARENLGIAILVFANRRYEVLEKEFLKMGAGVPGPRARDMLSIGSPDLDWTGLARAQGVEAGRAEDLASLSAQLHRAMAASGPYLVEVCL